MKTIFFTFFLITSSAFAAPMNLRCTNLINGNDSRKASETVKSIDLKIILDVQAEDAEMSGTMTNEKRTETFFEGFTDDRKMSQKGDIVTVKSHTGTILLCSLAADNICHSWTSLTVNVKTGEALYEESDSMTPIFIKVKPLKSIRFSCSLE